jgi:hypothetical protein
MAIAQIVATVTAMALWGIGSYIGGFETKIALAGAAESGVLLVVSLVTLFLFSPNKQRPIATLATLWSVTSFVRFLVALLASALLYYAAQFGLRPLLFSFLLAAVLLLICETRVIAGSLAKLSHSTED